MITTKEALVNWLIELKLPSQVACNELAMVAWENALADPTAGKIKAFYNLSGMERFLDLQVQWYEVAKDEV